MNICSSHIEDDDIRALIRASLERGAACSFCHRAPACSIEVVTDRIIEAVAQYYDDAANVLFYISADGGYQGPTYDGDELLFGEIGLEVRSDRHLSAVQRALTQAVEDVVWTERDWERPAESMIASWNRCSTLLTHGVRYFIGDPNAARKDPDEPTIATPVQIMGKVCRIIEENELFTTLLRGRRVFRARQHARSESLRSTLDLGPPPPRLARSGRMNAAGIPVFYGAFERETAIAETAKGNGVLAVGEFRTERDLLLVDLASIPQIPGFFAGRTRDERDGIVFLRRFSEDLSRPLHRDDDVHLDYVPTQVITEYIRYRMRLGGRKADGIIYPSAAAPGGRCLALFCTRANLKLTARDRSKLTSAESDINGEDPWLRKVRVSRTEVAMAVRVVADGKA